MPLSLPIADVLEALPDAVVVADDRDTIVLANEQAGRLFGRPPEELVGQPVEMLVPERDREAMRRAAAARPRALGVRPDVRALRADGSELRVEFALGAFDENGHRYTVASIRDVTDRRRAEALRVRAHQHAALAELGQRALAGVGVAALMQAAAGTVAGVLEVELVEVLELQPGREQFAMRGMAGWEHLPLVPVADTQVGLSLDRRAPVIVRDTATERRFDAAALRAAHGVVSGLAVPMVSGGRELGAIGVHSRRPREFSEDDVHFVQAVANVVAAAMERRRAERAVEQASARLQAVLDASHAVIHLRDLEGRVTVASRGFEALFGLAPGAAVGRTLEELLDAGTAAAIAADDEAVLAAGAPQETEERLRGRVFISLKFPLRDAAGTIHGVGAVSTDVTERTQAAAERAELETRLARAERLETVGQLAGGIAHDFNNLLAVIGNYAEFLRDAVEPGSQAAADLEQILVAGRSANELTRRLLLFSRRRAGNPEVIDVSAVITETEQLLRRTLGERVDLRTAVTPELWPVRADRAQLEQVLMNLAINGRDAMPSGGMLAIAADNVELAPGAVPALEGSAVRVTVSDTGAGMPADVADRAFEPFFTTKAAGEGTGLGLATVYGIVRGAGGHVELRSAPGEGTAAVVHLPAARGASPADEGDGISAPLGGRGECVLLVEDKEAVRLLSERILADAGYEVRAAADAAAALAVGDAHVDVLLTDVVMPGMSGIELADELRRRRPALPVVFVSGYTEDYVVEEARRDGATAFVEKPFAAAELLDAVRSVLDEPRGN